MPGGLKRFEPLDSATKRLLRRAVLRQSTVRDEAFARVIRSIPKGKVSTYGKVAAAAGYPLYHRAVARLLRMEVAFTLPWQRVVGAGGAIKLRFDAEEEQRLRLKLEGVPFRGKLVDMDAAEHAFVTELLDNPSS